MSNFMINEKHTISQNLILIWFVGHLWLDNIDPVKTGICLCCTNIFYNCLKYFQALEFPLLQ